MREPHSQDDLEKLLQTLPEELATSYNLGLADVYPAISGKHNAAKHLLEVFKASADSAVLMADDDNDLGETFWWPEPVPTGGVHGIGWIRGADI